jgi:transcriptional regulator with XRE-family HTH domain
MTVQELNTLFGNNLRYYRKKKGWYCRQLAKKMGIHEVMINYYEHGRSLPSAKHLVNLAFVLGIEIWQLFYKDTGL